MRVVEKLDWKGLSESNDRKDDRFRLQRNREGCGHVQFNPSFTDWVQNVPRRGIFLNNSPWYREKLHQFFYSFIEVPLTQNNNHSAHTFFKCGIFLIQLDDVEGAVFFQHLRTEEQAVNVGSAQNGCARATVLIKFK
jgi:hypothetical protein